LRLKSPALMGRGLPLTFNIVAGDDVECCYVVAR
jgi:hypothetical protein